MPLCYVHIESGVIACCISICRSALIYVAVIMLRGKSGSRKQEKGVLSVRGNHRRTTSRPSLFENVLNFPKCLSNRVRSMLVC